MSDVKVLSSRFEGNPNILLEVACLKKIYDIINKFQEKLYIWKRRILFKNNLYYIDKKILIQSLNKKNIILMIILNKL